MSKNYMVVMLPNEDSNRTIEIDKSSFFDDYHDAYGHFISLVEEDNPCAKLPIPKTVAPLDYETRTGMRIQLWIVQIPEIVP